MSQLALPVGLSDHAVFETYHPGPNTEAFQHLRSLKTRNREAVLWLWGPHGVGKSHLLQAVCEQAARDGRHAGYLPMTRCRELDVGVLAGFDTLEYVCVDDLDMVLGSSEWEVALFSLFNGVVERRGALVVAARSAPAASNIDLADLASRFASATVYRLESLDDTGRLRALQRRASHRGLELPDETGQWLLRRQPRDMGSLYELLDRLDDASLAAQRRLTIPFVRAVLRG